MESKRMTESEGKRSREFNFWCELTGMSALAGFLVGSAKGARLTGLRYTAENSHRKPRDKGGWFIYHRQKRYEMVLAGVRSGLYDAGRFGLLLGGFYGLDILMDMMNEEVRWYHGAASGFITASIFSAINKFPKSLATRATILGTLFGFGYTGSLYVGLMMQNNQEMNYANKYSSTLSTTTFASETSEI